MAVLAVGRHGKNCAPSGTEASAQAGKEHTFLTSQERKCTLPKRVAARQLKLKTAIASLRALLVASSAYLFGKCRFTSDDVSLQLEKVCIGHE